MVPGGDSGAAASSAPAPIAGEEQTNAWAYLAERYDTNDNAVIEPNEYSRSSFARLDRNEDGVLTEDDFPQAAGARGGDRMRRGEGPGRGEGRARGDRPRGERSALGERGGERGSRRGGGRDGESGAPEGEWAPDFELPYDEGEGTVRLSSFRDERPVALIFGSYT